ncbi:hypothetical protein TRVA0_043S00914 [Trichomonascus vanleenenianus]|uniref:uncharacterized protein n=1 Tax=Trichomonascus vanleenenianus TaxID=2268995 RepID=UPI003EC9CE2D
MATRNPFADPPSAVGRSSPVALNLNSNNPFRDAVGYQAKNPFREASNGESAATKKREAFVPLIYQITPEKNITYDTPQNNSIYSAEGLTNATSDKIRSRYRKKSSTKSSRSSSTKSSPKTDHQPTLFDKIEAMQMGVLAPAAAKRDYRQRISDPRRLSMESRPLSIPDYELSHPQYQEQELKAIFGPGASARAMEFDLKGASKPKKYDPLSPIPAQFAQMPRLVDESVPFRTLVMYSLDPDLSKGFPSCFPLCLMSHSVTMKDWKQFVEDTCYSYSSPRGSLSADSEEQDPPATTTIRRTKTLLRHIKPSKPSIKRSTGPNEGSLKHAQELVAQWNTHFFNARKVHVTLQSPKEADDYATFISREHHLTASSHSKWYQKSSDKPRLLIFSL